MSPALRRPVWPASTIAHCTWMSDVRRWIYGRIVCHKFQLAGKRKIIVTDANEITIDREFLEKLTLYLEEISQQYISNDDIREKRACWINSVCSMMELLNELGNDHGPTRRMLLE